jgi:hypothetical protein
LIESRLGAELERWSAAPARDFRGALLGARGENISNVGGVGPQPVEAAIDVLAVVDLRFDHSVREHVDRMRDPLEPRLHPPTPYRRSSRKLIRHWVGAYRAPRLVSSELFANRRLTEIVRGHVANEVLDEADEAL